MVPKMKWWKQKTIHGCKTSQHNTNGKYINNIYRGRACSPRFQIPRTCPLTRQPYCEGLASAYVQMDTWSEQTSSNECNACTQKTDSCMNNICHGLQRSYRFRIYLCGLVLSGATLLNGSDNLTDLGYAVVYACCVVLVRFFLTLLQF